MPKPWAHHILALESNMKVFTKVLELLIEMATLEPDTEHVHNFDIDYLIKKHSGRLFDCE